MLLQKMINRASKEEKKLTGEDVSNVDPDILEFGKYFIKGVSGLNKDLPFNEQFNSMTELDNRILLSMEHLKKLPVYKPPSFKNKSNTPNSTIELIMDIVHMMEFILTIIEDINIGTTPQMNSSSFSSGTINTSINSPTVNSSPINSSVVNAGTINTPSVSASSSTVNSQAGNSQIISSSINYSTNISTNSSSTTTPVNHPNYQPSLNTILKRTDLEKAWDRIIFSRK